MTENEPPTTPGQPLADPSPTPTRWQRMRGVASSRRPRGRAAAVLIGIGGLVVGLLVAGVLAFTVFDGGGQGGHGAKAAGADRAIAQGHAGKQAARGAVEGRGAAARAGTPGGPAVQVQPGGTVIVQPGATVIQQPAPAAAAPAAPAVPAPAVPAVPAPAAPAAPAPTG